MFFYCSTECVDSGLFDSDLVLRKWKIHHAPLRSAVVEEVDKIEKMIEIERHSSCRAISHELNISHMAFEESCYTN